MAQLISITSEALQATIRRLLPSQQGFGEDLQASNVITPVIDVTPTAEGSQLPLELSAAFTFGSNSSFSVGNATTAIINVPGFYRVVGTATLNPSASSDAIVSVIAASGASTVNLWSVNTALTGAQSQISQDFDLVVFVDTSQTISISANAQAESHGSHRQIADRYGNIVNPNGFTFE